MIANLSTFLINFFLPDNLRYLELIKLAPPKRKKNCSFSCSSKIIMLKKIKKKEKKKYRKIHHEPRRHSFLIANLSVPVINLFPFIGTWRRFRAVPPINISIRNVLGPGTREPPTWKGPPPGGSSRASAPCIFVPPPFEK